MFNVEITPTKNSSWWRRLLSSSSIDVFKKSSRCLDKDEYICLGHTLSRRLQEVIITSSRCLQDVFKRYYDWNWTACVNTSSIYLHDLLNTFLRPTAGTILYKKICTGHTAEKFMVHLQILKNILKSFF